MESLPESKSKSGQVGVDSNILHNFVYRRSYVIIICLNSHERLTKTEIRLVIILGFLIIFGTSISFFAYS